MWATQWIKLLWSWFRFNNLGLTWGVVFKFYTSVRKWLKLSFWEITPIFVEVVLLGKVEKRTFFLPILNRVKHDNCIVKLGSIPTSSIILTILKISLLEKVFDAVNVCLWKIVFMYCLQTPHCSVLCLE